MYWRINFTEREVWPLPSTTRRWSLGPWNVLPDKPIFVSLRCLATRDCNNVIYNGDSGTCHISSAPPKELEINLLAQTSYLEGLKTKGQSRRQYVTELQHKIWTPNCSRVGNTLWVLSMHLSQKSVMLSGTSQEETTRSFKFGPLPDFVPCGSSFVIKKL